MLSSGPLTTTWGMMRRFALVLLIAPVLAAAACVGSKPVEADLILTGGTIHTLAPGVGSVTALATRTGRILAVGDDETILRHRGDTTPVIDLKGQTVIPGLIDAHVHPIAVGEAILNEETGGSLYVDLSMTESEEDAVQRMRTRARELRPGQWVLGKGWNQVQWIESTLPDKRLLSEIVRYNPAFLVRSDGHTVWVNKKALEMAGITARTPDPPGGRILRHQRTGEPTGILLDRAWERVLRLVPPLTIEEKTAALMAALRRFAESGYTMLHAAGTISRLGLIDLGAPREESVELFRRLALEGRLPIRISLMVAGPSEAAEGLLRRGPEIGLAEGRLDIRTIKLFADGALSSRGAALLEPYADEPGHSGGLRMTREEIASWATRGLRRGVQIAVHAIGDAAVRETVGGFSDALASSPGADARFRIEHLSLFDDSDLRVIKTTGTIASVQPRFLSSSQDGLMPDGPMEAARVGEHRSRRIYAFGTLMEAGIPLAGSSDASDRLGHPLLGFYAAVTRQAPDWRVDGAWRPEQSLTREEALRMFTLGAAHAAFHENEAGSLEPGKWADFTILSQDLMSVPDRDILATEVMATYVGGVEVFRRGRPPAP
ncbi:MAG: amidohydrolase [Acidobacteria bacterium]|nr:amidohydrolase [Acidobacteriota bacterium]